MQNMSAKDAKYGFGRLIDLARSGPVVVEKHGRPVVVVLAIEEYERLREASNDRPIRLNPDSNDPIAKRSRVERT